ncbi:unnamed protein product [Amoebophrya sp. A120]|nr:unnamed protein product [Amoebophrya sp. A120]|eukprot:GSA120T00021643001.1
MPSVAAAAPSATSMQRSSSAKASPVLSENLKRNITKHMVEETEDSSRHMVTMLASRVNQVGCQILAAFPPHMREMKVKDVWGLLEQQGSAATNDKREQASSSSAPGKTTGPGPGAIASSSQKRSSLPPNRKPGENLTPAMDDVKYMTVNDCISFHLFSPRTILQNGFVFMASCRRPTTFLHITTG